MAEVEIDGSRHELIPLSDTARWNAALEGVRHAFAHRWEHCHAFALSSGLPTFLYHFRSGDRRVVCPLSERCFDGERDVFTPYGFAGMAANGPVPGFDRHWRNFALSQGWICAYLQGYPLLDNPLAAEELGVVQHNIFVLNLGKTDEELLGRMSASRRRQIRRLAEAGFEVAADSGAAVDFIVGQAPAFFTARSAAPVYHFAEATWQHLLSAPGLVALVAHHRAEVVAATLFGVVGEIGDFLFNISTPNGRAASAILLWEGMKLLRTKGCGVLNLGGGVGPGDGLAEFKRRFGAQPLPLLSHRQIYRPNVFHHLCQRAGVVAGSDVAYFPPYHAPRCLEPCSR